MNLVTLERRLDGLYYLARVFWNQNRVKEAEQVERIINAYEEVWNEQAV